MDCAPFSKANADHWIDSVRSLYCPNVSRQCARRKFWATGVVMSVRWRALRSLVAVTAFAVPIGAAAGENAGHSLADKFAHESSGVTRVNSNEDALRQKLESEERLKADEAEMLERAKAEAEERRKAGDADDDKAARDRASREKARIKQAAEKLRLAHEKDDADRRAADAKRVADEQAAKAAAEAEKVRLAAKAEADRRAAELEQRRLAEERTAAERKAAEAEKARLAEAEKARLAEVAEAERRAKEAEKLRVAREAEDAERKRLVAAKAEADRRAAEDARKRIEEAAHADAQRRMEAEREDEARRLSEKLARAREQREAAKNLGTGYSALGNPPPRGSEQEPPRNESAPETRGVVRGAAPVEARATVLLVLKPGTRGIRRYEKTADPIVCLGETCYVGSGADVAAAKMTRGRALGPGNTLGQRAGACRHSLTCIFREVDVSAGRFEVQPVDLRLLRHDRRETVTTEADRTCAVSSGRLRCGRPVEAGSYRIWVVPESVARRAGVNALWSAVADGLPSSATADLDR